VTTNHLSDPVLLRDLVIANRIVAHEGVVDPFGHVSIRCPDEPGHYVISRSLGPELVTKSDLQRFTLAGEQVGGNTLAAYSERAIHGAVYEARPDVMAVCHNHSPSVIPFGVTGIPLRPVYHLGSLIGPDIPVWDMADDFGDTDMLVRSLDQGRSLARTLGPRRVALMRGHGSVVAGSTLREVVMTSVYLEQNARLLLQALAIGQVHYLSAGEIELSGASQLSGPGTERAWTTWAARTGLGT
jgi:HCOMODA/2-hydroxy-3-carboxy-muconic semialdehyde decarboxylase